MTNNNLDTKKNKGSNLILSITIFCTALMVGIVTYVVLFRLKVPIYYFTDLSHFFYSLAILPFLALICIACSFRLINRNVWQKFGVILITFSVTISALTVIQWIVIDVLYIKKIIIVQEAWKAMIVGLVLALIIYIASKRAFGSYKKRFWAHTILIFSSLCIAVSVFHVFQLYTGLTTGPGCGGQTSIQRHPADYLVDTKAPIFSLRTVNGETYSLEKDRGKVILLNFGATWCAPCMEEMSHLDKLNREIADTNIIFLAVNIDLDTVKLKSLIDSLNYSLTTLYGTSEVSQAYKLDVLPTAYFIDKKGIIREVEIGWNEKSPERYKHIIQKLLDE